MKLFARAFLVCLLLGASNAAWPQDTPAGARIAATGLGNAPACSACHGARGEGGGTVPRLAGLDAAYLEAQLAAFANDTRASETMRPIAEALPAKDRSAIAAYYASLPMPAHPHAAPAGLVGSGRALAQRGDWNAGVPPCASCHGTQGLGVGTAFPPLAGQHADYIAAQFAAWRNGARRDDPMGLMANIARRLSPAQIAAVAAYYSDGAKPDPTIFTSSPAPAVASGFAPPPESSIPAGPFGDAIREGERIFKDPAAAAPQFVGNALHCANCHLGAGRLANSAPLWAAYVAYPAFRSTNGHVNSFAERLQDCFRFSMNGTAPPLGGNVLIALESYAFFLAQGAPVGRDLPGRGYPGLPEPAQAPDYARGERVFAQKCALCHGADGQGNISGGKTVFPPLWGARSYNWGAGMALLDIAAEFIEGNMPLSQAGSLTDQEAWDLAAFIDSHERPQDPRYVGSVAATRAKFHETPMSMYGHRVNGVLLGGEATRLGAK